VNPEQYENDICPICHIPACGEFIGEPLGFDVGEPLDEDTDQPDE
jgi:hypothetical protein